MDLPEEEEGELPLAPVVVLDDDGLIFSEAQLAESLSDHSHHHPDHVGVVEEVGEEEIIHHQEHDHLQHHHDPHDVQGEEGELPMQMGEEVDMEVDAIIHGDGGELQDDGPMNLTDSLLDTTDEGDARILETIVEEASAEEQALVEQVQGEQQQILQQQQQAEEQGEQVIPPPEERGVEQVPPPQEEGEEVLPPVEEEEEEEEPEPPCNCPTCQENSDENGVFKGLDPTVAKCLICYANVPAPEHCIKRQQQKEAPVVEISGDVGEEGGGGGSGEGVTVSTEEMETQRILPDASIDQLASEQPGLAGSAIGIKSEARDPAAEGGVNLKEGESGLEKEDLIGRGVEGMAQRMKDALSEKMAEMDPEHSEEDPHLNLDLIFQVLSCSFEDLDQDIDLLLNFVPLCSPCHSVVMEAALVFGEIQRMERTLGNLRETIKDQVSRSFDANFCKRRKETEEIVGLVGQIDATRRAILGEDCPAIAKLLNYKKKGRRGRKPGRKKKTVINRSALYPQVTLESMGSKSKGRGRPRKRKGFIDSSGVKQEFASEPEDFEDDEDYMNEEEPEEEEETEVIQTHSGRKVKKPNYKKWLLGDDEDEELEKPAEIKPIKIEEEGAVSPKSEPDWSPGHSDEEFQEGAESESSSDDSDLGNSDDDGDLDEDDDEDDDYRERAPARKRSRRTSSGANRIPCTECNRTFADEEKKDKHFQRYHTPEGEMRMRRRRGRGGGMLRVHPCSECEKEFKRPNLLKRHLEKEHGIMPENGESSDKKKHICEFCGQKYRNGSELRVHVRLHTGETPFKCDHCDQSFVSALKRETHIEQCHWDVPPLKCEFCDRAFFRQHRLRIHRITHTGERAYLCEICSQAFSHPTYLKYHQGQHAELNMESYKCKECGKQFANPTNLKLHVKTVHLKEFRFSCEVCGMGFTHMSHKRIHMRGHTGERPYKCEICSESFRYKDRLRIHLRGHTGERPFVCDVCKKGFASRSKLKRHEKIHEKSLGNRSSQEDEPARPLRYSCDDCGKAFAEPQHLSAHKRYCQRKNFEKDDRPKATKSAPGKIKATSTPAAVAVQAVTPTAAPVATAVQKIQIEHIPAHAIQGQQTQMLVPVTYTTYPVAYGYEVAPQYQQQQHPSNVRDYQNYN